MKKYISGVALALLVGVIYFNSSQSMQNQPDVFEEYADFAVDPIPETKPIDVLPFQEPMPQVQSYGYGQAPVGYPVFEWGAIKLKSAGIGRCGGLTLVPYPGAKVFVRARRFRKTPFGKEAQPEKKWLSEPVEVESSGLRVRYDRGTFPTTGNPGYYKVFCYTPDMRGNLHPVDCTQVMSIQNVKQGLCIWGPGGVDADYAPLNMSVKYKP